MINWSFYVLDLIHSPKKSGTMSWPQDLIKELWLWCLVTRLLVSSKPVTVLGDVLSIFLSTIAILQTQRSQLPGESWSSKLMRSRDLIAIPTSMVWTSPEITPAPWSRNGTPLSRPSYRPRLRTATSWECSQLASPRRPQDRWRPLATLKRPRRSSSDKRWWRLCKPVFRSPTSKTSSKSCKYAKLLNLFLSNYLYFY